MMRFKTFFIYTGVALFLLILLIWVGSAAYSAWQGYRFEKKTEEFQLALSKPYREDNYGGKTPEETWAMFLDALRKGDVDLASKYIVPEKREQRLKDMKQAKIDGRLSTAIEKYSIKLEKEPVGEVLEKETARFFILLKNKDGYNESYSIIFILNPYTKVWKISLL
jgi:hypothetical protein